MTEREQSATLEQQEDDTRPCSGSGCLNWARPPFTKCAECSGAMDAIAHRNQAEPLEDE